MKPFAVLILMLFFSISCQTSNDNNSNTTEEIEEFPRGFEDFYQKFHNDSIFQINHISWPLMGLPSSLDTTVTEQSLKSFFWSKDNWKIHKNFNHNVDFIREFQMLGDNIVIEVSTHQTLGFKMVRRFSKTNDGWNMIYYAAP